MTQASSAAQPSAPMRDDELQALADALARARTTRVPVALPPDFAVRCGAEQAARIAERHAAQVLAAHGGRVHGAKLGGTNRAALEKLGLQRPLLGPVFSAFTYASPAALPRDGFLLCVLEAELAVRLGRPLDGRAGAPSREALVDAIEAVFPVIEIADSRLAGFPAVPPVAITADLGFAGALVTGAPCEGWRALDLAGLGVSMSVNGEVVREGRGAEVLGHPLNALADYVEQLGAQGRVVPAGELVTTGTWTQPYMGQRGERVVADFGPLGRVELQLT